MGLLEVNKKPVPFSALKQYLGSLWAKNKFQELAIGIVLLIFITSLAIFVLRPRQAAAAVTIDTSTAAGATKNANQRKTFYDNSNNLYWAFYYNGSAIEYSNSSDGTAWTSRGTVNINSGLFSVWYVETTTTVYLITYLDPSTTAQKGTLAATSVSWGSSTEVFSSAGNGVPSISRDSNGKLWAVHKNSGKNIIAKESTNADDTSSWGAEQSVDVAASGYADYSPLVLPMTTSGDMYIIWSERDENGDSYLIEGRLWDDSAGSFGTTATIYSLASGEIEMYQFVSAVAGPNDEVYLLYNDHAVRHVSGQVEFVKYAGGSWGSPIILDSDTGNVDVSITKDPSSGDLYAFWQRANTIYYKKGVSTYGSGNWDTNATTLYSTGTNAQLSAGYQGGGNKVFIEWTNGTGSPYNVYFDSISTNTAPATPTLSSPASGATGVSQTPSFSFSATDGQSDYLRYRIYLYQSDCSTAVGSSPFTQPDGLPQTGWSDQDSQTGTAYASGTAANYTYQGTLSASTTYCWKVEARDPGGTNTYGTASSTRLFTTIVPNVAPSSPALLQPSTSQTGVATLPQLRFYSTDNDSDYIRYWLDICSTSNCSTVVRSICQHSTGTGVPGSCSASQTGWASQSLQSATAYSSGQTAIHLYQAPALNANTQYWWRAYAIDPAGSDSWSSASSIGTFTTGQSSQVDVDIRGGTSIQGGTTLGND